MNITELDIKLYTTSKSSEPVDIPEGNYEDCNKKLNGRNKIQNTDSGNFYWLDSEDYDKFFNNTEVLSPKEEQKTEENTTQPQEESMSKIQDTCDFKQPNTVLCDIIHEVKPNDTPEGIARKYNIPVSDVVRVFDPTKKYNIIRTYNRVI